MLIDHIASAGTLESSDIMITIEPGTNGIELNTYKPRYTTIWKAYPQNHNRYASPARL